MKQLKNWNIEQMIGYKPITTYYTDLSIAERFGLDAIKDTYNKIIKSEIGYKELTEFVMALNWKIWEQYDKDAKEDSKKNKMARLYNDLWNSAAEHAMKTLKGDELSYYFRTVD